jgi:glycerophosphoryl diester phosphodiesterase
MMNSLDRRTFLKLAAASTAALAFPHILRADAPAQIPFPPAHKVLIAHRGASIDAPENTLPAYELAIKDGADYVEQDLQITKDAILVCSHDATLERVTNVKELFPDRFTLDHPKNKPPVKHWYIHDFTIAEIKTLDAGSSHSPKFKGVTIPTWQEAIDTIRGKSGLCPETKSPELYARIGFDFEQIVFDTLKKNNLHHSAGNDSTPILIQSFSKPSLVKLRNKLSIDWPLMQLGLKGKLPPTDILADIKTYASVVCPDFKDITAELTQSAHSLGLKMFAYTFSSDNVKGFPNVSAQMHHYLYDINIDGLFTNNPDQFPRESKS